MEGLHKSDWSAKNIANIKATEREMEILISLEDYYWRQRSWVEWQKEGDMNTMHFNLKASNHKKKN